MKKILLLLISLILCACSSNTANSFPVNENLTLSVKLKDNMEYIMVDQYTKVEDIDFMPYLEIEADENAKLEIKWVGSSLSYQYPTYEGIIGTEMYIYGESKDKFYGTPLREDHLQTSREITLSQDGFHPISIYVKATLNNEVVEKRFDTQLLLVPVLFPDGKDNLIRSLNGSSIEEIQNELVKAFIKKYPPYTALVTDANGSTYYDTVVDLYDYVDSNYIFEKYGYVSNIR